MPKFSLPKSNVIYRIRNADNRLYLERGTSSNPQMRPDDSTDEQQHVGLQLFWCCKTNSTIRLQWRFVLIPNTRPPAYSIQDPYIRPQDPIPELYYVPGFPDDFSVNEQIPGGPEFNTWVFNDNGAQKDAA